MPAVDGGVKAVGEDGVQPAAFARHGKLGKPPELRLILAKQTEPNHSGSGPRALAAGLLDDIGQLLGQGRALVRPRDQGERAAVLCRLYGEVPADRLVALKLDEEAWPVIPVEGGLPNRTVPGAAAARR
jgi:hypothetical protein